MTIMELARKCLVEYMKLPDQVIVDEKCANHAAWLLGLDTTPYACTDLDDDNRIEIECSLCWMREVKDIDPNWSIDALKNEQDKEEHKRAKKIDVWKENYLKKFIEVK